MKLETYLLARVLRLAGLLLLALVLLVLLYLTVVYTSAENYNVPPTVLLNLFGVHFIRYLPRMIVIAMFMATLLCYIRLHNGRELLAMASAGFGFARHARIIFVLSLATAGVVAVLTMSIAHRVEERYNNLRGQIGQIWSDPGVLQPGKFHHDDRNSVYFGERDETGAMVDGVYTYIKQDDGYSVITSNSATMHGSGKNIAIVYEQGVVYRFTGDSRSSMEFSKYIVPLELPFSVREDYDTWEIAELLRAGTGKHYAAVHKRLASIVAALLLPLLALLLVVYGSRWRSHYTVVLVAIAVFFIYYNLIDVAHTTLRKGVLDAMPGMLFPHLCLLLLLVLLWLPLRLSPYRVG